MKKFVSLGFALVMCLALMIPAIATEETFETENSALVPTVEVELPSSGLVILNPYGMQYTGNAMDGIAANATSQILSNIFALTNKTKGAPLKVTTTVTAVAEGNASLDPTNTSIASTDKANSVILSLTYSIKGSATALSTTATEKKTLQLTGSEQNLQDKDGKDIVLAAATESANTYLTFQFSGSANTHPETPWTEDDTVGATFVFTFEPTTETVTTALSAGS
jgi:hypothetical protein